MAKNQSLAVCQCHAFKIDRNAIPTAGVIRSEKYSAVQTTAAIRSKKISSVRTAEIFNSQSQKGGRPAARLGMFFLSPEDGCRSPEATRHSQSTALIVLGIQCTDPKL